MYKVTPPGDVHMLTRAGVVSAAPMHVLPHVHPSTRLDVSGGESRGADGNRGDEEHLLTGEVIVWGGTHEAFHRTLCSPAQMFGQNGSH
ncbi:unnamed protein product [Arctogadus glacialis]